MCSRHFLCIPPILSLYRSVYHKLMRKSFRGDHLLNTYVWGGRGWQHKALKPYSREPRSHHMEHLFQWILCFAADLKSISVGLFLACPRLSPSVSSSLTVSLWFSPAHPSLFPALPSSLLPLTLYHSLKGAGIAWSEAGMCKLLRV